MNQQQDLASAVMKRDRSRSRVRMLTVTVGAASLATAGVVAYNLPGSTHTTAVSGSNNTTTTPSAQPSAAAQSQVATRAWAATRSWGASWCFRGPAADRVHLAGLIDQAGGQAELGQPGR